MNATYDKRRLQDRHPRGNHFLAALFATAMVIILTVPAFAAEMTADTNEPDTEISISTPDIAALPTDEGGEFPDEPDESEPTPMPPPVLVSTAEELLDAIANASENEVIEFDTFIQIPSDSELILGRPDCPVTLRRAASEAWGTGGRECHSTKHYV